MLEIRETTMEDIYNIQRLWADGDVMRFVGFPDGLRETDEAMQAWFCRMSEERPSANHFSIYEDGEYCGEAGYGIDRGYASAWLDIKLFRFARGRGIAAKALSYVMKEAFRNGAETVWVDPAPQNAKALALYDRLGFVRKDMPEHVIAMGEDPEANIYMELRREDEHKTVVKLRDVTQSDIADYVRWFTTQTEWMGWDAPWEREDCTEEEAWRDWTAYYERVSARPEDCFRWRLEIEADGVHVGWVSAYTDMEWKTCEENALAVGIDLPEESVRGRGVGAEALKLFVDYCKSHGYTTIYIQTWSGNARMIALAHKLGFREVNRLPGIRRVRGEAYDALTFRLEE